MIRTKPFILAAKIFLLAMFCAGSAHAAACATPTEKTALDLKAVQTELMMSALTCGQKENYNRFLKAYEKLITVEGQELRGYFVRAYPENGEEVMNEKITKMANQLSDASLKHNLAAYCDYTHKVFTSLLTTRTYNDILNLSTHARYSGAHGVTLCQNRNLANDTHQN